MSPEENKAIIPRFIDEVMDGKNAEASDQLGMMQQVGVIPALDQPGG